MINGLHQNYNGTNELQYSIFPMNTSPDGDYIGYNPTINQSEYGTPRESGYGIQIRTNPRYGIIDRFATFPFRGIRNYVGAQSYGHPISEMLYSRLHGYRGVLPINQLPLINKPFPYEVPLYEQFGMA